MQAFFSFKKKGNETYSQFSNRFRKEINQLENKHRRGKTTTDNGRKKLETWGKLIDNLAVKVKAERTRKGLPNIPLATIVKTTADELVANNPVSTWNTLLTNANRKLQRSPRVIQRNGGGGGNNNNGQGIRNILDGKYNNTPPPNNKMNRIIQANSQKALNGMAPNRPSNNNNSGGGGSAMNKIRAAAAKTKATSAFSTARKSFNKLKGVNSNPNGTTNNPLNPNTRTSLQKARNGLKKINKGKNSSRMGPVVEKKLSLANQLKAGRQGLKQVVKNKPVFGPKNNRTNAQKAQAGLRSTSQGNTMRAGISLSNRGRNANQAASKRGKVANNKAQAGLNKSRPSWRQSMNMTAERKLQKYYGNKGRLTTRGNVTPRTNAAYGASNASRALRSSAFNARKRTPTKPGVQMGLKKTPVSKPVASTTTKNPMQIAKEKMNAKRKARGASTSNIMGGKPINGFTRTQRNMGARMRGRGGVSKRKRR